MIIGITGKKAHGKDTVGAVFIRKGFLREYFAAPLKEAIKIALNMTDEQVHGDVSAKETVDPRYGITPRHAMQTLGTEWGRNLIHQDVWAIACLSRIKSSEAPNWVITDTRFINEAVIIKENGGVLVKVLRPNSDNGNFENHQSEQQTDLIDADYTILNDGTLAELEAKVGALVDELQRKYG